MATNRLVEASDAHGSVIADDASTCLIAALTDKPSIAVLPFQNMSGDPEQDYFADGIVEDMITALSRFKSLFVIARNSSFTYKRRAVDIKQVGHELGVSYVLEGSVRKIGNRVRITGQLIEAATSAHIWADKFDASVEDLFEVQDKVTVSVVGAIAPTLERVEIDRARTKPPDRLDAYDSRVAGNSTYAPQSNTGKSLRSIQRSHQTGSGICLGLRVSRIHKPVGPSGPWPAYIG
jgi:adenylate cyclase